MRSLVRYEKRPNKRAWLLRKTNAGTRKRRKERVIWTTKDSNFLRWVLLVSNVLKHGLQKPKVTHLHVRFYNFPANTAKSRIISHTRIFSYRAHSTTRFSYIWISNRTSQKSNWLIPHFYWPITIYVHYAPFYFTSAPLIPEFCKFHLLQEDDINNAKTCF